MHSEIDFHNLKKKFNILVIIIVILTISILVYLYLRKSSLYYQHFLFPN